MTRAVRPVALTAAVALGVVVIGMTLSQTGKSADGHHRIADLMGNGHGQSIQAFHAQMCQPPVFLQCFLFIGMGLLARTDRLGL